MTSGVRHQAGVLPLRGGFELFADCDYLPGMKATMQPNCDHCDKSFFFRSVRVGNGRFCSNDCASLSLETPPHQRPVFWLRQILPPMAIIFGVFLPMDIGSVAILGPIYLFALYWVFTVPSWLLCKALQRPIYGPRHVRGLMSVVFLAAVFTASSLSMDAAVTAAAEAAEAIQERCASDGRCPDTLPNWESKVGLTITYQLHYQPSEDRHSFRVFLRQNIDRSLTWRGGVNSNLLRPGDPLPRGITP